jgi:hypothetical protein
MVTPALLLLAWPKSMSVSVAGVRVDQREPFHLAWHDAKTGYFVYKTFECDGGHVSLTLTRDRRGAGYVYDTSRFGRKPYEEAKEQIVDRSFPLATGHGIKIGMVRAELTRRLGKPYRVAVRGPKREFWCAMYKQVAGKKDSGVVLRNTYIFKHGKLIEVSLNHDRLPGCGSDSMSDADWPWTHF